MFRLCWCLSLFLLASVGNALQVSQLVFEDAVDRGSTYRLKLTLLNDQTYADQIILKLNDYATHHDGRIFYEKIGTQSRSNAGWIELHNRTIALEPGQSKDVYLTVTVPEDSQLQGSYWSVLLVEPTATPSSNSQSSNKNFELFVKIRYACQIVTTLPNGKAALKVIAKDVQLINEEPKLCIDVANTGTLFLNPDLTLKLYNEKGQLESTLKVDTERLYPGSSQRYFLNAKQIQGKKLNAFLVLDNKNNVLFCDNFLLDCL